MQPSTHRTVHRSLAIVLTLIALLLGGAPTTATGVLAPTTSGVVDIKAGSVARLITIRGTGFEASPIVTSLDYDVTVANPVLVDSTSIRLSVTTHDGAALGPRRLKITNVGGTSVTCACINLTWPYAAAVATAQPNIIVINTDDQRGDSMSQLPMTNARTDWARFENSFVHEPQCCPSRATLFTGQYVFRHGVSTLRDGERLSEKNTIATMLHSAGYQTVMSGKYLNGYPFGRTPYTPPGWDDFRAFGGPNASAPLDSSGVAVGYPYVNYFNIENTVTRNYTDIPADYSTDRYAAMVRNFLRKADPTRPVFSYLAPVAPHFVTRPADRDKATCLGVTLPANPSFNAHDTVSEPKWMADVKAVSAVSMLKQRRGTCQALQAVDLAVSSLFTELQASGRLNNTYVIFTSDNGYSFGEHRLDGKGHLYEESIRVPLLIRGPGVVGGVRTRLTSNVDLAPTLVELGKASAPTGFFNGQSFADDLKGTNTVPNPNDVLLFGCRTRSGLGAFCGGSTDFMGQAWGIRTRTYKYIRYAQTGETQLFNLANDPQELTNRTDSPEYQTIKAALDARLSTLISSTGTISGRITDAATGAPLASIMVHLELGTGSFVRDVMTDTDGRYAFLPLKHTTYKLRVDDPKAALRWYGGFDSRTSSPAITVTAGTTVIDMAMQRTGGAAPTVPSPTLISPDDYPH